MLLKKNLVKRARQQAGLKAKREGQNWERSFEINCTEADIRFIRIPDGCKQLGRFKLIRVKSPFDYLISYNGKTACIDLKSFGTGTRLTYSHINQNQLIALLNMRRDCLTGYVVFFRSVGKVVFYDSLLMNKLSKGESLEISQGHLLDNLGQSLPLLLCQP